MLTCIKGSGGKRTALAIARFWLWDADLDVDDWAAQLNELWKAKQRLGCPNCGAAKRFGIGPCRRCYVLRSRLRIAQQSATTIRGVIFNHQKQFDAFAKSLSSEVAMSRSERLDRLLKWKPENYQH